jgi:hypothetical protein
MPETLLNVFERFCDDLPETVRDDLLFMMVALSDEDLVVDELDDIDERVRALFGARTFVGRMGNLINAVSIFDVFFALDADERFGLNRSQPEYRGLQSDMAQSLVLNGYADRKRAIVAAKQLWMELRRTTLSPEAIATALVSVNSTLDCEHASAVMRAEHGGAT